MTNAARLAIVCTLIFYVLGILMFLAGCIILIGYAGRGPRDNEPTANLKKR